MACTITLESVKGLAPDANNTPASLTISGSVSGGCQQLFLQLGGQAGLLAPVANNQFEAVLLLGQQYQSGDLDCDADNDITLSIQCMSGDSCQLQQPLGAIDCASCVLSFSENAVTGVAGTLTDTPVEVAVRGAVSGCDNVQVRFTYAPNDPGATAWKDAVITGDEWQATFTYDPTSNTPDDYPKDVACGQTITVEARCPGDDACNISGQFEIRCRQRHDCPAPGLSARITKECRNNRRVVIFTVSLTGVTTDTDVSGQIHTGDTSIGTEIQIPVQYPAETAAEWSGSGGTVQRSFEHTYPPGVYDPVLTLVGACAAETGARPIVDPDDNPVDTLTVAACDCEEASICVQACRVTDERLTCADDIDDDDCQPLAEVDLQSGNLPPGLYVLRAETDPPDAGPISWSINGEPQPGASGAQFCVELEAGDALTINAAANLGLNCPIAADAITLQAALPDDNEVPGNGDDGGNGNGNGGGGNGNGNDNDGCLIDWCKLWLLLNIGLAFLTGAAIVITACLLFNPANVTNIFWIGVGVSVVLALVSIISFIVWAFVCGRLPGLCEPMAWVLDILSLLSAASGILALILGLFGHVPCAIGMVINFAYYGFLAWIILTTMRVAGCPIGRNGLIGVIIDFFTWLGDVLGL